MTRRVIISLHKPVAPVDAGATYIINTLSPHALPVMERIVQGRQPPEGMTEKCM